MIYSTILKYKLCYEIQIKFLFYILYGYLAKTSTYLFNKKKKTSGAVTYYWVTICIVYSNHRFSSLTLAMKLKFTREWDGNDGEPIVL